MKGDSTSRTPFFKQFPDFSRPFLSIRSTLIIRWWQSPTLTISQEKWILVHTPQKGMVYRPLYHHTKGIACLGGETKCLPRSFFSRPSYWRSATSPSPPQSWPGCLLAFERIALWGLSSSCWFHHYSFPLYFLSTSSPPFSKELRVLVSHPHRPSQGVDCWDHHSFFAMWKISSFQSSANQGYF